MSAFGGKADITRTCSDVCFWPKADIGGCEPLGARPGGLITYAADLSDQYSRTPGDEALGLKKPPTEAPSITSSGHVGDIDCIPPDIQQNKTVRSELNGHGPLRCGCNYFGRLLPSCCIRSMLYGHIPLSETDSAQSRKRSCCRQPRMPEQVQVNEVPLRTYSRLSSRCAQVAVQLDATVFVVAAQTVYVRKAGWS